MTFYLKARNFNGKSFKLTFVSFVQSVFVQKKCDLNLFCLAKKKKILILQKKVEGKKTICIYLDLKGFALM